MDQLSKLLRHNLIGAYTHFEATEIFVCRSRGALPENVFTILVAEERGDDALQSPEYLGERIKVRTLDGWVFGIKRHTKAIADLLPEVAKLEASGVWEGAGEHLQFGQLHRVPAQFVPPDSTKQVPWNRVLKNNFWNGSYVIEWSDRKKDALAPIFASPPALQELAGEILTNVPIDIAGLSDRLGNLVVQLPVTSIVSEFEPRRSGECLIKLAWRPGVTPRPLRAQCHFDFDGTVGAFASGPVAEPETLLAAENGRGLHHGYLWDEESGTLLAAAGPTGFIESIRMNIMAVGGGDPRTFSYTDARGAPREHRVQMHHAGVQTLIGDRDGDETGGRTRKRIYREQEETLKQEREFVSYYPAKNGAENEHKRALNDMRILIGRHGRIGAWLWDPYLNAYDVLETLFWSGQSGADLRALTAAKVPPASDDCGAENSVGTTKQHFIEGQRKILDSVQSNWIGFRLEYRARHGQFGWDFHDRFLIFPQADGAALAWSLGTSVNSLGGAHHIFQKVSEGQLVMNAFEEIWDELVEPDHLIWKKP